MAFINIEKKHEGSLISYIRGYWHTFSKYDWEETITKKATCAGASLGIGLASFGVITAVGTVLGGPIGAVVGAGIGAIFGAGSALVSTGIGIAYNLAYSKYTRQEMQDRLNRSDYKERSSETPDTKSTELGHYFKIKDPKSLLAISDLLEVSILEVWEHPRNKDLRSHIEKATEKSEKTDSPPNHADYLIPAGKKVWIPIKYDEDPEVGDFRSEATKLTRLLRRSIRDSVVHLRKAIAIYQQMPERLTGGRWYAPGEKETFRQAVANIRKQFKGFAFIDDAILYSDRNPGTLTRHVVKSGETLASIATKEDCTWHEILEYGDNWDLRKFYLNRKLWPEKEPNRHVPLEGVREILIPKGILPADRIVWYRIYEYDGKLEVQGDERPNYLPAGKPIWVPTAHPLAIENFKSCDEMIEQIQIVLEMVHHLNKFRNYLLPCLNLSQMYLDSFQEFAAYRDHAQEVIEDAVLEYQQFGEHKNCKVAGAWNALFMNWSLALPWKKSWVDRIMGRRHWVDWKCMRDALKNANREAGKPVEHLVSDDETFDSIAADHKISVQALISYNYRKRRISHDTVAYDNKKKDWTVKREAPESGATLLIPPSNKVDRVVYGDVWGNLQVSPNQATNQYVGDYAQNFASSVAIAEIDIEDIRKDIDTMIDSFQKRLAENRKIHHDDWFKRPKERRRYFWMLQDILHDLDFPGTGTRIAHKFGNLNMKYTAGEKALATLGVTVDVLGSALSSALSEGAGAGAKLLFPKASAMNALKDLFMNKGGEELQKFVSKTALEQGPSSAVSKVIQPLVGLVISKGGGKIHDKQAKKVITDAHRLNFRKERISVAAQMTGQRTADKGQESLKLASREAEDLFMKISRHSHYAFAILQSRLVPMLGKLEANKSEVGYGLAGCKDCYQHLKVLYEYQHQVDKSERYLVASLALVKHLYDFENYFSEVERNIQDILVRSAGRFVIEGDHTACHRKKVVGHHSCYGPDDTGSGRPYRPLRSRSAQDKPDVPSREGRQPKSELKQEPDEPK